MKLSEMNQFEWVTLLSFIATIGLTILIAVSQILGL